MQQFYIDNYDKIEESKKKKDILWERNETIFVTFMVSFINSKN
jgi:hypothetical protein